MSITPAKLKKLPDTPGVYFFMAKNKEILYIGKATSLKSRVRSYFSADIADKRSPAIARMVSKAVAVDFTKTESVLEALMLEADLIRKFKPLYNIEEKDDKSFNCVVFTEEKYPRLMIVRKKDIREEGGVTFAVRRGKKIELRKVFGPFPEGGLLRQALKIVRRIFPYRDEKCEVSTGHPCFNRQIGLCPGTCTGEISPSEYGRIIGRISLLLQGKMTALKKELARDMKMYAKEQQFEQASEIKRQLASLKHIQDVSLLTADRKQHGFRMEAYDVAHLSGTGVVGVMVVAYNGHFQKSEYRMFNIPAEVGSGDVPALKNILERRSAHAEWELPRIIVCDGGVAQFGAVTEILSEKGLIAKIAVVAVVKDERHKAREILGDSDARTRYAKEIIALNAEAHRFALSLQKKKRKIR